MVVNIAEVIEQLKLQQKFHYDLANTYNEVILDLEKNFSAGIQVEDVSEPTKKGNSGRHFSPEHREKLSAAHKRRAEEKRLQKEKEEQQNEKARINAEQVRLLQPQAVAK